MLRFLTLSAFALVAAAAAPGPYNVFQIDITPEEAQKYLNSPPFTEPQLSPRTNVLPLVRYNDPSFRSAEAGPTLGHYWKNGHEIENTNDYVEEVYDASQFHGQDGLGAYAYGYETPESAKVENRQSTGNLQGSYTFRDGNNKLIKVKYWSDGEGFHQEDNIPKVVLQPAQETEEVRQARLEHEKAWQAARAASLLAPNPEGQYIPDKYETEYQGSASAYEPSFAAPEQQVREGKAYTGTPNQGAQYQGAQYQGAQYQGAQYQGAQYQGAQYQGKQLQGAQYQEKQLTEPEPTGPPRGFFYSFTYPVSIIVPKNELGANAGTPVDHDSVAVNAQH